jgi:predicted transcriptional regulator
MAMLSNVIRAGKTIAAMPIGSWMEVRGLAKNAKLGVQTMCRYLAQAKKQGLVENKCVLVSSGRLHLWRRTK